MGSETEVYVFYLDPFDPRTGTLRAPAFKVYHKCESTVPMSIVQWGLSLSVGCESNGV